jgi:hypothetical protein
MYKEFQEQWSEEWTNTPEEWSNTPQFHSSYCLFCDNTYLNLIRWENIEWDKLMED